MRGNLTQEADDTRACLEYFETLDISYPDSDQIMTNTGDVSRKQRLMDVIELLRLHQTGSVDLLS